MNYELFLFHAKSAKNFAKVAKIIKNLRSLRFLCDFAWNNKKNAKKKILTFII